MEEACGPAGSRRRVGHADQLDDGGAVRTEPRDVASLLERSQPDDALVELAHAIEVRDGEPHRTDAGVRVDRHIRSVADVARRGEVGFRPSRSD